MNNIVKKLSYSTICRKATNFQTLYSRSFTNQQEQHKFDTKLLDYLGCPVSKQKLVYNSQTNELFSPEIGFAFPILNGVPQLRPDLARKLKPEEIGSSAQ